MGPGYGACCQGGLVIEGGCARLLVQLQKEIFESKELHEQQEALWGHKERSVIQGRVVSKQTTEESTNHLGS